MSISLRSLTIGLGLICFSLLAQAQQPASLPVAPATGAPIPVVASPAPTDAPGEVLGQSYSVEVLSGTSFIGVLTAASPEELTFQTKDLGLLTVKRANIKQLAAMTPEQVRYGFDYQGNGNRLFFAPTARNLRKGEGSVQSIYVILMGVNYGINDNISVGALFSVLPSAFTDNLFALTPKVSFPVSEKLRVGAGALLVLANRAVGTLAYANATYGSADHNLTGGIGYALADGRRSQAPVILLGGATRVGRRVSLVNETYIYSGADNFSQGTYLSGIAGIRVSGQRVSSGLGLLYGLRNSYIPALPFAEVTFRFGRVK